MCLVNGETQYHLPIQDRGLQYGDGLFETMAVAGSKVRFLDEHFERMEWGCARLGLVAPGRDVLRSEIASLSGDAANAVIKLIVTRGASKRGYRPDPMAEPTRILTLHPWPDYPQRCYEGIDARICETRSGINPALAGVKHLNRLEQVLATREWSGEHVREGIMRDVYGRVVGGTMSNIFVCCSGELVTPQITDCGVRGVMRGVVIELARRRGIVVSERGVELEDMLQGDEIFFTNTLIGIWPAVRIDNEKFAVGPMTRALMQDLASLGVAECAGPA